MPLLENDLARRDGTGVTLRESPLRVRWELQGLSTSDALDLHCTFTASVQAIADDLERRMLTEVLLGNRAAVTASDLATHFGPALAAAASKAAGRYPASAWVDGDSAARSAMAEGLAGAARPLAFACGVEVLPPFQVEFRSEAHQQLRLREIHHAAAEQRAASQLEEVQRAGKLLSQFENLRHAAPELSAGKLLERLTPTDRGSTLRMLLLAGAQDERKTSLWAVAGPYLVRIDPTRAESRPELIPLPPTLGPLRSVQPAEIDGDQVLLVGAQSGVMMIRIQDPTEPRLFASPATRSQLGFNQVRFLTQSRAVCATHAEAGVVIWDWDHPASPRTVLPSSAQASISLPSPASMMVTEGGASRVSQGAPPAGPRNLLALGDDSILFSIGAQLLRWDGAQVRPVAGEFKASIVAILSSDRHSIAVVDEDGTIGLIDAGAPDRMRSTLRRGVRVRAAGALPWLDGVRLLLATDGGPVQCLGLEDGIVTEYLSSYRGLRMVCGSPATVAAVSPDRQRLIVWNSWDGHQPAAELYLTGLTRHRVADIDFA